jgi:hypothetical protein
MVFWRGRKIDALPRHGKIWISCKILQDNYLARSSKILQDLAISCKILQENNYFTYVSKTSVCKGCSRLQDRARSCNISQDLARKYYQIRGYLKVFNVSIG